MHQIATRPSIGDGLDRRPRRPRPMDLFGVLSERQTAAAMDDAEEAQQLMDDLVALLREDAVLTMPPQADVAGAEAIRAFFARVHGGRLIPAATWANGLPAVALRERTAHGRETAHRLLVLIVDGDRIARIDAHADAAVLNAFSGAGQAPAMAASSLGT